VATEKKAEDLVALYAEAGLHSELGIYPTAEQWALLLDYPKDKKIHLASLFIFSSDPVATLGEEALQLYDVINKKVGARDVYHASVVGTFTGEGGDVMWQDFSIKEFASRDAFLEFLTDPRLLGLQKKRSTFVKRQQTIILLPDV
jgi:hypothetical protein